MGESVMANYHVGIYSVGIYVSVNECIVSPSEKCCLLWF